MLEQQRDFAARLRATIEEELGALRQLADVPSAELEEMAARLVRAIVPLIPVTPELPESRAA